jgi:hypothetical protein
MSFRFVAFEEHITQAPFASVDGVMYPGHPHETLNLAHWPGNTTPPYLKAKTTVEMALKLLRFSGWRKLIDPAQVLSNNHYDTDGVLACWILMAPEIAPRYAQSMIAAGIAGDYQVFTTPFGVQFDLLLTNLEHDPNSPLVDQLSGLNEVQTSQFLYDWVLERLPILFDQLDDYEALWKPQYMAIEAGLRAIAAGKAIIREHTDAVLAVVESEDWLPAMARRSRTQGGRLLSICPQPHGTLFELEYTLFTFHDVPDRLSIQRPDLSNVAEHFNQLETSTAGRWVYDTSFEPVPKLHFVDSQEQLVPSQLSPMMVEQYFHEFFASLGDTWPYLAELPWGRFVKDKIIPVSLTIDL